MSSELQTYNKSQKLEEWVRQVEECSNNLAERSIKPFVIDRKNFLFANTPKGAKNSAVAFSLIETSKASGIDPYKYLVYIFKTAPTLSSTDEN